MTIPARPPEEMIPIISAKVQAARIPAMIVTMGADGAVYANLHGESGYCPARKLEVKDTTGAGDAFLRRCGHRPDLRQGSEGSL